MFSSNVTSLMFFRKTLLYRNKRRSILESKRCKLIVDVRDSGICGFEDAAKQGIVFVGLIHGLPKTKMYCVLDGRHVGRDQQGSIRIYWLPQMRQIPRCSFCNITSVSARNHWLETWRSHYTRPAHSMLSSIMLSEAWCAINLCPVFTCLTPERLRHY